MILYQFFILILFKLVVDHCRWNALKIQIVQYFVADVLNVIIFKHFYLHKILNK
jgi:hypothetical protein